MTSLWHNSGILLLNLRGKETVEYFWKRRDLIIFWNCLALMQSKNEPMKEQKNVKDRNNEKGI